jgi:hypothetical protein
MARAVSLLRVFFAGPQDVAPELDRAKQVIDEWNRSTGETNDTHAQLTHWSTDSYPDVGRRPQDTINRQVLDKADVLIGVFWSRFGSPTGKASSGTEEEIRRSIKSRRPVLLYFSDCPLPPSRVDQKQYGAVQRFRKEFGNKALYSLYSTVDEFERLLSRHLSRVLTPIMRKAKPPHPTKVAIGLVTKRSDILLVRRRLREGPLEWQFPAGMMKPTENGQQAVVREG